MAHKYNKHTITKQANHIKLCYKVPALRLVLLFSWIQEHGPQGKQAKKGRCGQFLQHPPLVLKL